MDWRTRLALYNRRERTLFDDPFLARWGELPWQPNEADKSAAASLHVELATRITTQRLGYAVGVEASALTSIYQLFEKLRATLHAHPEGRHFEAVALHVLNTHVRPFTAKWHRRAEGGALDALDAADEFRAELAILQQLLSDFDDLLVEIRGGAVPVRVDGARELDPVRVEMQRTLEFGIPDALAPVVGDSADAAAVNTAERAFIGRSRSLRGSKAPQGADAVGLALSGGGIRSATFSLGVLIALARRNILPQIDYLSTVSGGGYIGSFLITFLSSPPPQTSPGVGLEASSLPFLREGGEAAALRHLRHHSRYLLTGSALERLRIGFAQLYGILVNVAALVLVVSAFALLEYVIRASLDHVGISLLTSVLIPLAAMALLVQLVSGLRRWGPATTESVNTALAASLFAVGGWVALGFLHELAERAALRVSAATVAEAAAGVFAVVAILLGIASIGCRIGTPRRSAILIFAILTPFFLLLLYLAAYAWLSVLAPRDLGATAFAIAVSGALLYAATDVNTTSLHRHYRDKLAGTFLIRRAANSGQDLTFDVGIRLKLSEVTPEHRGPYPLINAALNVPGSRNAAMQGRLADFFLFSPAFTGSPVTGYRESRAWEDVDPELDLATAMAISGAAASPQAGLKRTGSLSLWLALLNVRLGYWVARPGQSAPRGPGLRHLLQEMFGTMDETAPLLHLSDGGHIENLGVYELLRRRCKYIIAVDGEQDPEMTFHALTNLQRLAAIDMDVKIDIDLDDLRLDPTGLSRSHFKFCRVRYPGGDFGYLLYVKLSLTGNEGEFIRRYRLDEPAFPHHSTADQFFTEAQFEAYRALGEHVGDKLFLAAIVGEIARMPEVVVADWFEAIGEGMLQPAC